MPENNVIHLPESNVVHLFPEKGGAVADSALVDHAQALAKDPGMKGVVVFALGHDTRLHFEFYGKVTRSEACFMAAKLTAFALDAPE